MDTVYDTQTQSKIQTSNDMATNVNKLHTLLMMMRIKERERTISKYVQFG